jgi:putative FmdB family regulatory protein
MPIYEYKCQSCGRVSEPLVHSLTGSEDLVCPHCGSHSLDRLLSVPGLLKGGSSPSGRTCCGREERCEMPPCSSGGQCRKV